MTTIPATVEPPVSPERDQIAILSAELRNIADADWRRWDKEYRSPDEFVAWAKNRARYALALAEATHPAAVALTMSKALEYVLSLAEARAEEYGSDDGYNAIDEVRKECSTQELTMSKEEIEELVRLEKSVSSGSGTWSSQLHGRIDALRAKLAKMGSGS